MTSPPDATPPKKARYVPSTHPGRALFRVEFPFGQRPNFTWKALSFPILDISERGIRLSAEGRAVFSPGTRVRGEAHFEDAKETVEGTVLHGNEREAVIQLTEGFSLERVRKEERRLIRGEPPSSPPLPPVSPRTS